MTEIIGEETLNGYVVIIYLVFLFLNVKGAQESIPPAY
jgi:hypothetical protein